MEEQRQLLKGSSPVHFSPMTLQLLFPGLHILDCEQTGGGKWLVRKILQVTVFVLLRLCFLLYQWQIPNMNACWYYNLKTIISHKCRVCTL